MTAAQLQAHAQPDAHAQPQPLSPPQAGRVALLALTPEARSALGGSEVVISAFPFRAGRESRGSHWAGARMVSERRSVALRGSSSSSISASEVRPCLTLSRPDWRRSLTPSRLAWSAMSCRRCRHGPGAAPSRGAISAC